jgi:MFS family permease
LFGFVGAVGILAAPVAGRLADRHGPQLIVRLGVTTALLSWALFGMWTTLAGLVTGVTLLDFGMQSALVSNQQMVFAIRPEARNRLNTVLMSGMFVGGAVGSTVATLAWTYADWPGVCAVGAGLAFLSFLAQSIDASQPITKG